MNNRIDDGNNRTKMPLWHFMNEILDFALHDPSSAVIAAAVIVVIIISSMHTQREKRIGLVQRCSNWDFLHLHAHKRNIIIYLIYEQRARENKKSIKIILDSFVRSFIHSFNKTKLLVVFCFLCFFRFEKLYVYNDTRRASDSESDSIYVSNELHLKLMK